MAVEVVRELGRETIQWNERNTQSIGASAPTADAAALHAAKKQRLLELLADLLQRGSITPAEVAASLRKSLPPGPLKQLNTVQSRMQNLQAELRFERAEKAILEGEVTRLESALRREHEFAKEGLYRIATLERQLEEARETTTKLVIASRDSLRTLRRVETDLADDGGAPYVLEPLVEDLCYMARAVKELHSVAGMRDATPPVTIENR